MVVGRPSFGKGLVQRQFRLEDGSAIRVTVARYHTPSGRVIQRPYENGHSEEYYAAHRERLTASRRNSVEAAAPRFETLRSHRRSTAAEASDPMCGSRPTPPGRPTTGWR